MFGSMPGAEFKFKASLETCRGILPTVWFELFVVADVGEGVPRRSGVALDVGDEFSVFDGAPCVWWALFEGVGGMGGKPPFPRPLRMVLVSFKRCCARSCCPRETRVRARVSISEVRSSILR